jgi:hypothetical protein
VNLRSQVEFKSAAAAMYWKRFEESFGAVVNWSTNYQDRVELDNEWVYANRDLFHEA